LLSLPPFAIDPMVKEHCISRG